MNVPGDLAAHVYNFSGEAAIAGTWIVIAASERMPTKRLYIATHPEHQSHGRLLMPSDVAGDDERDHAMQVLTVQRTQLTW